MKLKVFSFFIFFLITINSFCQNKIQGTINCTKLKVGLSKVNIYDFYDGYLSSSDSIGNFIINSKKEELKLVFHKDEYNYLTLNLKSDSFYTINLSPLLITLNEVLITENFDFDSGKLSDIVENAIYAGKKTEKIILENKIGSVATNNSRQIYNKISGLNIFQNDDAGIQLNIGGRGLNPSRSANFNTRQNNYDISADVLGYPESYYSPPAEALKQIQIVRGAASLQYGTQFGGLVNFIFKKPVADKKIEFLTRNTIGSNSLFTNFSSLSGSINKASYYTFLNYKKGDGFRPNSKFESLNLFAFLNYNLTEKTKLQIEVTYLNYLAQQAGGLTDEMFIDNPLQSNRTRNWFKVNWFLHSTKLLYKKNSTTNLSLNLFGLSAYRYALGFRDNRVDQIDPGNERDLIKGNFNNIGLETRFLKKYNLKNQQMALLLGNKVYIAKNNSVQGPGSSENDADFTIYDDMYPYYYNQSYYDYPNLNVSFFGENIFYLNNKISITPGFRFEHINTQRDGQYLYIYKDLALNPIFDTTYYENNLNIRTFVLFGAGISYKANKKNELYSNLSQNYRSVTFADISIKSPSFKINPNINDEMGCSFDIGVRSKNRSKIRYDINYFSLIYKDRIGFVSKKFEENGYTTVKTEKGNIGNALISGIESLVDYNYEVLFSKYDKLNVYCNFAYTNSYYYESQVNGITGNTVEFTPKFNVKTGLKYDYKKMMLKFQYTYLSSQFTDASNAVKSDITGIIGEIPEYDILDLSFGIKLKLFSLYYGINNLTNNLYYTRRATGYPGPGIIPSPNRNYYITFEVAL